MYQIEVKRYLVQQLFNPKDGWNVTVDLDAMELGKGDQQSQGKRQIAEAHLQWFIDQGITIGKHSELGRADVVAEHGIKGRYVIEAEGDTSRQKEQALYSALGQTILLMRKGDSGLIYGLAVPDSDRWEYQLTKIPKYICDKLSLNLFLVSEKEVRKLSSYM